MRRMVLVQNIQQDAPETRFMCSTGKPIDTPPPLGSRCRRTAIYQIHPNAPSTLVTCEDHLQDSLDYAISLG